VFSASQEITSCFMAREGSLPYSQVLATCPILSPSPCVASPRNTPPSPREPLGGVVYLRIALSREEASGLVSITLLFFLRRGVVSTSPNPQAGGPPLVGCLRLLI
jgi:hypothetical protein